MLFPALHTLTDIIEWVQSGFSVTQLWLNYVAFLPLPAVVLGLYAAQYPRISKLGLVGSLLYGFAFIYFAHSTLEALATTAITYEELWSHLGWPYTFHGGLMVVGGLLFGFATWRAGMLPTWTAALFLLGIMTNLVVAVLPVPDLIQTIGSGLRNAGLIGMGWAVVRIGHTKDRSE